MVCLLLCLSLCKLVLSTVEAFVTLLTWFPRRTCRPRTCRTDFEHVFHLKHENCEHVYQITIMSFTGKHVSCEHVCNTLEISAVASMSDYAHVILNKTFQLYTHVGQTMNISI